MKKILGLIAVCLSLTSLALADSEFPDFFSRLEFQTYGGLSFPTQYAFFHTYNVGTNEGSSLGYRVNSSFSILLDQNLHSFPDTIHYGLKSANGDIFELAILAKYRVPSPHSRINPYFFAGGGVAWNGSEGTSNAGLPVFFDDWYINPMAEGGVGLQWAANDTIGVFLQQKISIVFNPNRIVFGDSPIDYFPIEAGINISPQTPGTPSSGSDSHSPNPTPAN